MASTIWTLIGSSRSSTSRSSPRLDSSARPRPAVALPGPTSPVPQREAEDGDRQMGAAWLGNEVADELIIVVPAVGDPVHRYHILYPTSDQAVRHCCIWRSPPSTSSTRALNAAVDTRD